MDKRICDPDEVSTPMLENETARKEKHWVMDNTGTKLQKILKTGCLVCVWICMGTYMEINGATLKDLVYRTGESYGTITGAVSGRSVGKFIGSVLGGFLIDKFGKFSDVIIACALLLAAVTVTCVPWVYNVSSLWFMYCALGILLGTTNIAGNRILLCMWLEKAAAPMHILHCGYGIGGFLAPLIANPFLADFVTVSHNASINTDERIVPGNHSLGGGHYLSSTPVSFETVTEEIATTTSRIEVGYGIVGGMTTFMSLVFFFLQFQSSKENRSKVQNTKTEEKGKENKLTKKRTLREMINPAVCANGNMMYGLVILGMLFTRYFFYTGADRLIGTFTRSYAVDYLDFSKDNGSYVNTVYWVAYSAGRIFCFFLANFLSVKILLPVESTGATVTLLLMIFFCIPTQYSQSYWYLIFFTGFFVGPMFPSGMAWADLHIDMTGLAITWVMLGSAFGGLTFYYVGGHAYDGHGPTAFIYIVFALLGLSCVLDVVLTVVSACCAKMYISDYNMETDYIQKPKKPYVKPTSINFQEEKL